MSGLDQQWNFLGGPFFNIFTRWPTRLWEDKFSTLSTIRLPSAALELTKSENGDAEPVEELTKPYHLKDTPGHPKLRSLALDGVDKPTSSYVGIIYMLDSAVLSSQARLTDTVEYLYELLLAIQQRYAALSESSAGSADPLQLLIACNKNDLFTSLPSAKISSLLQVELGRMKETKRKGLLNAGADEADDEDLGRVLGDENSDQVTWDSLRDYGVDISIQSGSVKNGSVDSWKSWMSELLTA
ncbi:hypothetical protein ABW19_dt0204610 [Dactylella cylindrospora]|nr:hypothetical protein ABW19_dt0204610 [Dactylella cylindrospora]